MADEISDSKRNDSFEKRIEKDVRDTVWTAFFGSKSRLL